MIRFPGLIDPHVHLRDPGQTQKEDFYTGTAAALAGGFTTVVDMLNNASPITTEKLLMEKRDIAQKKILCDVGFHFGSLGDNLDEFEKIKDSVFGLKLYLNMTTGGYIIDKNNLRKIYLKWHEVTKGQKPILLHAEEDVIDSVAAIVKETKQPTHIVHVSSEEELTKILKLKDQGLPITTGVTPHHLFLIKDDEPKLGSFGLMKPALKNKNDQEFLWQHFNEIDIIESDHAPHAKEEKENSTPPFGIPGLETTLPLLLTAMNQGRLTKENIIDKCYTRPKEIFHVPDQPDTHVDVDENEEWTLENDKLFTKCKWSPFNGWKMKGKVKRVVLHGQRVFEKDTIVAEQGFGKLL